MARLKKLDMPVRTSRAKTPLVYFQQPCAALCTDGTCRIYADRPSQCREFECRVYKETAAGEMDPAEALKWIKQARTQGESARRWLRRLGDNDETRSLHERFRRMQKRLNTEGAGADEGEYVAKLNLAMHRLHLLAHERFHTRPEQA